MSHPVEPIINITSDEWRAPSEASQQMQSPPVFVRSEGRYAYPVIAPELADSETSSVEKFIAKPLLKIPGVRRILMRREREFIRIWVLIDEPNLAVEEKIYHVYVELLPKIQSSQHQIETDLTVIYLDGRPSESIEITHANPISAD